MSKKGLVHPDTTKIRCAYLYASLGNYSEVARQTKIKRTSIMNWAKDCDVWHEAVNKARQEISDELLAQNLALTKAANEEIADRIENGDYKLTKDGVVRVPMGGKELAVVSGIKEEKACVAMGKPTSIRTDTNPQDSILKLLEQMSKTYHDKQINVVSTQSPAGKGMNDGKSH